MDENRNNDNLFVDEEATSYENTYKREETKQEENPYGGNPYGGSTNYGENNYRENPYGDHDYGQNEKKIGFGVASLVLGIISLVFFCACCNVITGILAIIFGIIQLVKYKPHGKGIAIGGIVTSVISIILCIVFYILVGSNAALSESILKNYEDIYNYDFSDPNSVEEFLEDIEGDSDTQELKNFGDEEDDSTYIIEDGENEFEENLPDNSIKRL